jgi:hypothetical protein
MNNYKKLFLCALIIDCNQTQPHWWDKAKDDIEETGSDVVKAGKKAGSTAVKAGKKAGSTAVKATKKVGSTVKDVANDIANLVPHYCYYWPEWVSYFPVKNLSITFGKQTIPLIEDYDLTEPELFTRLTKIHELNEHDYFIKAQAQKNLGKQIYFDFSINHKDKTVTVTTCEKYPCIGMLMGSKTFALKDHKDYKYVKIHINHKTKSYTINKKICITPYIKSHSYSSKH